MKLFVYGTLMSGQHNHRLLENELKPEKAYIYGNIYDTGYGYPAVEILGKSGELGTRNYRYDLELTKRLIINDVEYKRVLGELYEIRDLNKFRVLDRLEGYDPGKESLFYRRLAPIMLMDGQVITSWVYEGSKRLFNHLIKIGDWRIYRESTKTLEEV